MYVDSQIELSNAQDISAGGTIVSTNVYDTGAAADIGIGQDLYLVSQLASSATGADNVQVVLQTSSDNSSWSTVLEGPEVTTVTAGTRLFVTKLPHGLSRYLRVQYVITGSISSGTVDTFITTNADAQQYLQSGVSAV